MLAPHLSEDIGEHVHGARLACTDPDGARKLAPAIGQLAFRLVNQRDDLLGSLAQAHAVLGEHGRAVGAVEQRTAQLALELGDLARQRGLRHMQHVGGLGHVLLACNGQKITQRPEFHRSAPYPFIFRIAR